MSSLTIISNLSSALQGEVFIAPDKSISHRLVMFSALANGESYIENLLMSEDIHRTIEAMKAMGASFFFEGDILRVKGVGLHGLSSPAEPINMGNSGTSARLISGIIASNNITATMVGDASLSKRPMARVIEPLTLMGATFKATNNNLLPMVIQGSANLKPITYNLKIPSAQVKSAILLAGLSISQTTTVVEPEKTRDHTERLLQFLGVDVVVDNKTIQIKGNKEWNGKHFKAVGDVSSAMFLIVAALLVKGSHIVIKNVGLNPLRTGGLKILLNMGANITIENQRLVQNEEVGDIVVKHSNLKSVKVDTDVPTFIDEIPILAVAAAYADGVSEFHDLAELKVKESNRLQSIYDGLKANHCNVEIGDSSLKITGSNNIIGGATIDSLGDHRIAMAFSVLGMVAKNSIVIKNAQEIKTSFPTYLSIVSSLGGNILEAN